MFRVHVVRQCLYEGGSETTQQVRFEHIIEAGITRLTQVDFGHEHLSEGASNDVRQSETQAQTLHCCIPVVTIIDAVEHHMALFGLHGIWYSKHIPSQRFEANVLLRRWMTR